jgi:hypothetical protein
MNTWLRMPLVFGFGFASGSVAVFLLLRSRLTFYRQFIESRLASIDFSAGSQKIAATSAHYGKTTRADYEPSAHYPTCACSNQRKSA